MRRTAVAALVLLAATPLVAGVHPAPELDIPPTVPTTAIDTALGWHLRAYRGAFGISQDSLSKLTHRVVSATNISYYERGMRHAPDSVADSLVLAVWRLYAARVPWRAESSFAAILRRNVGRMHR